jgi:predicted Zn-dependent peptidase
MKYQVTTLSNKLRVASAEMADAFSVTISVAVGVGSRHEQFATNGGVSHFLEHLLFKGTQRRPSTKIISEQIDAVGGMNNAYTTNELTNYYVKVPYQHLELGLDILADMIRNSLFDPSEIDRERGVVLEEMNVSRDDPASYVYRLTPELLWPGHPLSRDVLGSEKVISSIQRQAIVDYQRAFYRPGNMVVSVAGRVKHEVVVKLAERLLGDIADQPIDASPAVKEELSERRSVTLTKDTAQTHLVISTTAYPFRHANDPAAKLITTILGQGLSSRLFMSVRERQGLAYSISTGLENFVDTGEFEVYAGVNLAKTPDAVAAILKELRLITEQPVGAEELDKAKNQIRGGLQMALENNSAVADRMGTQLLLLGRMRSVEETLAEIEAVTVDEVQRVAAEMLAPERLRLGLISPNPEPIAAEFEHLVTKNRK